MYRSNWGTVKSPRLVGGVDEAFVDEAGAGGAELLRAAAHDRCDVAGAVFAGAKFGHRAQVLQFEFGGAFGADAEE